MSTYKVNCTYILTVSGRFSCSGSVTFIFCKQNTTPVSYFKFAYMRYIEQFYVFKFSKECETELVVLIDQEYSVRSGT